MSADAGGNANPLAREQEMLVADAERRANLRLRAEQGDSLCLGEHSVSRAPYSGGPVMFTVTCSERGNLATVTFRQDPTEGDVKAWMERTAAAHDRREAGRVVLELLDEIEAP